MDQALNQKIDAYIAENKEQLLQDIAALVAIDSVEGTPEEGAPFGAGPRAALDKTLELAAGMGFATRNCENYIGYAELAGADPEKYLATICHVDVVPVGNGWTADPFKMRIQDGWLLGRGVSDDKGPMIVTLYALKFLKEQGYQLRYPIRAIVGDNEETHMNDVKYYLENYPAPVFCFTPDAEFPVCNGEKGHFGGKIVSPVCNGVIAEFEGGVANNAVPDRASALVKTDIRKLKNAPNITLEPEGDGVRVRGWGKSGHAAMPEGTVNAIGLVADYLLDNGLCNDAERAYLEALRKLHSSTAGTGLGIDCADGPFGPLTIIGGRIYMEDGKLVQTIDSRFPTCTNGEKLTAQITAALGEGAKLEDVGALWTDIIGVADSPSTTFVGLANASTPLVWLGIIAYSLQLYFDFSGYSLMGIGMGKMLGFDFPTNFNYPYISASITEFWRRWHMTLSGWFREYVYIPLGGNRKGLKRQILNLFIVELLTGIWHGANWNFICWGLYYFVLLAAEKLFLLPYLKKGKVWPHFYTLFLVVVGWAMFVGNDTGVSFGLLFQKLFIPSGGVSPLYFLRNYGALLAVSVVCCTPLIEKLWDVLRKNVVTRCAAILTLLVVSTAYVVGSTNSPFLYFNF